MGAAAERQHVRWLMVRKIRSSIVVLIPCILVFAQVIAQPDDRGLRYRNEQYGFSFVYPAPERHLSITEKGPDEHSDREFYLSIGWLIPMISVEVLTNPKNLELKKFAYGRLSRWGLSSDDIEMEETTVAGEKAVRMSFVQIAGAGCPTVHVALPIDGRVLWFDSWCHTDKLPQLLGSFDFYKRRRH